MAGRTRSTSSCWWQTQENQVSLVSLENHTIHRESSGSLLDNQQAVVVVDLHSLRKVVETCSPKSSSILPGTVRWQLYCFWRSSNGLHHTACTGLRRSSPGQGRTCPLGSFSSPGRFLQGSKNLRVTAGG